MKRRVTFSPEDINAVKVIAIRENFPEVENILNSSSFGEITLTPREAQILINLMVFEAYRLTLKYPYDDTKHPEFDKNHKNLQEDFLYGIYLRFTMAIEQLFEINRHGTKV